jgi:hypothetical protein
VLISKALILPAQDTLHLGQGPMSHAHSLIQGNVACRAEGRVS